MKVVCVIPARYSSKRLPGKPLMLINGKPMIQRVYEQAKKSKLINEVIVATDDKRIFECVKNFGGKVVMTSHRHKSGSDRICEAIKNINCDIVVNIQGDEPFINPDNIDMAIKPVMENTNVKVSTLCIKFSDKNSLFDKNKVKVVLDKENFALYFSRSIIPYNKEYFNKPKMEIRKVKFYKHIGLYVYRKNFLLRFAKMKKSYLECAEELEQLRILENGERIKVVLTNKDSASIDTREDFEKIKRSFA